jgi:hypothetical protein
VKQLILLLGPIVASSCFMIACSSRAETPNAVKHDAEAAADKVGDTVEKAGEKIKEGGEKVQEKVEEKKEEIKKDP